MSHADHPLPAQRALTWPTGWYAATVLAVTSLLVTGTVPHSEPVEAPAAKDAPVAATAPAPQTEPVAPTAAVPATVEDADKRVADDALADDLFASRSWQPPPAPPPPVQPAPPPAPTAPPFPYTYIGSVSPDGETAVYYLARDDRVFEAHVGDHLDDVYEFESATGGQLVFNYLPLNIRQSVPAGAAP